MAEDLEEKVALTRQLIGVAALLLEIEAWGRLRRGSSSSPSSRTPQSDSLLILLQRPSGPLRPLDGGGRRKARGRRAISFIWVVSVLESAAGP